MVVNKARCCVYRCAEFDWSNQSKKFIVMVARSLVIHGVATSFGFFIYGGLFVNLFSLILFSIEPKILELSTVGLILIASLAANMAIFLFVVAFRIAQKFYGIISCLHYLQMLWAVLIGIVFFGEYLNLLSGIGAILIFSSGVMALTAQYRGTKVQNTRMPREELR